MKPSRADYKPHGWACRTCYPRASPAVAAAVVLGLSLIGWAALILAAKAAL